MKFTSKNYDTIRAVYTFWCPDTYVRMCSPGQHGPSM